MQATGSTAVVRVTSCRAELRSERGRGGGPIFGPQREAAHHDRFERGRDLRHELARRRHEPLLALQDELGQRVRLERRPSGQELVEDDAERVDVGGAQ